MHSRVATLTVRIMGPNWTHYLAKSKNNSDAFAEMDRSNQEVIDRLGKTLGEIEENLSSTLPEGYFIKIEG